MKTKLLAAILLSTLIAAPAYAQYYPLQPRRDPYPYSYPVTPQGQDLQRQNAEMLRLQREQNMILEQQRMDNLNRDNLNRLRELQRDLDRR